MNKVLSGDLWAEIKRLAGKSKVKRAAVAYVSSDEYVKFGAGDILIVDASNPAIASGQTSAGVLARALKRGAAVYSCPGLHAKVLIFDDWAIIGSANISLSSANNLIEAGLVTNDATVVGAAHDLLQQLRQRAQPVDSAFVKHIKKIRVARRGDSANGPTFKSRLTGPKFWILYGTRANRVYAQQIKAQASEAA